MSLCRDSLNRAMAEVLVDVEGGGGIEGAGMEELALAVPFEREGYGED